MRQFFLKTVSCALIISFFWQELSFAHPDLKPVEINFSSTVARLWADDFVGALPEFAATVEDVWRAPSAGKTLILIQDAHTNDSAQANIAKTLEVLLSSKARPRYIFLEAGDGDVSLSFLRGNISLEKRKQVAWSYLKTGELRGSEYLDLISDRAISLWGVEDKALYHEAMEAYRAIAHDRDKFEEYLKKIKQTIEALKPRVFSPSLLMFDRRHEKSVTEEVSLTDYFLALSAEAAECGISLKKYPHLKILKNLKSWEDALDFKKANTEEAQAMRVLSEKDLELLERARPISKLSSQTHREQDAFYRILEEKLQGRTRFYPELFKYFNYLKKSRSIDPGKILEEKKLLEEAVYRSLATESDEALLHQADEALRYLEDLFNLTLTPEQFQEYARNPKKYDIARLTGFLNHKIMELQSVYERTAFLEPGYEEFVRHARNFYEITYRRDQAFLKNSLAKMGDDRAAVLITGGYHSPNLKSLLKRQNVSYICLTPQILHETNKKRYEKILFDRAKSLPPATAVSSAAFMDAWAARQVPPVVNSLRSDLGASLEKPVLAAARLADNLAKARKQFLSIQEDMRRSELSSFEPSYVDRARAFRAVFRANEAFEQKEFRAALHEFKFAKEALAAIGEHYYLDRLRNALVFWAGLAHASDPKLASEIYWQEAIFYFQEACGATNGIPVTSSNSPVFEESRFNLSSEMRSLEAMMASHKYNPKLLLGFRRAMNGHIRESVDAMSHEAGSSPFFRTKIEDLQKALLSEDGSLRNAYNYLELSQAALYEKPPAQPRDLEALAAEFLSIQEDLEGGGYPALKAYDLMVIGNQWMRRGDFHKAFLQFFEAEKILREGRETRFARRLKNTAQNVGVASKPFPESRLQRALWGWAALETVGDLALASEISRRLALIHLDAAVAAWAEFFAKDGPAESGIRDYWQPFFSVMEEARKLLSTEELTEALLGQFRLLLTNKLKPALEQLRTVKASDPRAFDLTTTLEIMNDRRWYFAKALFYLRASLDLKDSTPGGARLAGDKKPYLVLPVTSLDLPESNWLSPVYKSGLAGEHLFDPGIYESSLIQSDWMDRFLRKAELASQKYIPGTTEGDLWGLFSAIYQSIEESMKESDSVYRELWPVVCGPATAAALKAFERIDLTLPPDKRFNARGHLYVDHEHDFVHAFLTIFENPWLYDPTFFQYGLPDDNGKIDFISDYQQLNQAALAWQEGSVEKVTDWNRANTLSSGAPGAKMPRPISNIYEGAIMRQPINDRRMTFSGKAILVEEALADRSFKPGNAKDATILLVHAPNYIAGENERNQRYKQYAEAVNKFSPQILSSLQAVVFYGAGDFLMYHAKRQLPKFLTKNPNVAFFYFKEPLEGLRGPLQNASIVIGNNDRVSLQFFGARLALPPLPEIVPGSLIEDAINDQKLPENQAARLAGQGEIQSELVSIEKSLRGAIVLKYGETRHWPAESRDRLFESYRWIKQGNQFFGRGDFEGARIQLYAAANALSSTEARVLSGRLQTTLVRWSDLIRETHPEIAREIYWSEAGMFSRAALLRTRTRAFRIFSSGATSEIFKSHWSHLGETLRAMENLFAESPSAESSAIFRELLTHQLPNSIDGMMRNSGDEAHLTGRLGHLQRILLRESGLLYKAEEYMEKSLALLGDGEGHSDGARLSKPSSLSRRAKPEFFHAARNLLPRNGARLAVLEAQHLKIYSLSKYRRPSLKKSGPQKIISSDQSESLLKLIRANGPAVRAEQPFLTYIHLEKFYDGSALAVARLSNLLIHLNARANAGAASPVVFVSSSDNAALISAAEDTAAKYGFKYLRFFHEKPDGFSGPAIHLGGKGYVNAGLRARYSEDKWFSLDADDQERRLYPVFASGQVVSLLSLILLDADKAYEIFIAANPEYKDQLSREDFKNSYITGDPIFQARYVFHGLLFKLQDAIRLYVLSRVTELSA